jgi:hypothetical protein
MQAKPLRLINIRENFERFQKDKRWRANSLKEMDSDWYNSDFIHLIIYKTCN